VVGACRVDRRLEDRPAIGRQHARELAHRGAIVGHVLEHVQAQDGVEAAVAEREARDVHARVRARRIEVDGEIAELRELGEAGADQLFGATCSSRSGALNTAVCRCRNSHSRRWRSSDPQRGHIAFRPPHHAEGEEAAKASATARAFHAIATPRRRQQTTIDLAQPAAQRGAACELSRNSSHGLRRDGAVDRVSRSREAAEDSMDYASRLAVRCGRAAIDPWRPCSPDAFPTSASPTPGRGGSIDVRREGATLIDLTESNPTQVGLPVAGDDTIEPLADPRAAHYRPEARGLESARAAIASYLRGEGRRCRPIASC
jgi:hypothetical protein